MQRDDGDGFLTRWARRKAEMQRAAPVAAPDAGDAAAVSEPDQPEAEFDVSTLPPIDSLNAASDITAFLQKNVPLALRNAALQKMWVMDESIRSYVGPSEMSWDFNVPDAIFGHGPIAADSDLAGMLADIADHRWLKPVEQPPGQEALPVIESADAVAVDAPPLATELTVAAQPADETKVEEDRNILPVRQRHGGATPR